MTYRQIHRDSVVVIAVAGKVIAGRQLADLQRDFQAELSRGYKSFVLDLKEVDWSDSSGLGLFLAMLIAVKQGQAKLVLANVGSVQRLLDMTRLIQLFECYSDCDQAVKALAG